MLCFFSHYITGAVTVLIWKMWETDMWALYPILQTLKLPYRNISATGFFESLREVQSQIRPSDRDLDHSIQLASVFQSAQH